jgi:hypothetical protein
MMNRSTAPTGIAISSLSPSTSRQMFPSPASPIVRRFSYKAPCCPRETLDLHVNAQRNSGPDITGMQPAAAPAVSYPTHNNAALGYLELLVRF